MSSSPWSCRHLRAAWRIVVGADFGARDDGLLRIDLVYAEKFDFAEVRDHVVERVTRRRS